MNNIRIQNLSAIYNQGLNQFVQSFLKEKAQNNESLVYSIDGKIIELEASDVLWIYEKLSNGPEDWEIKLLNDLASKGEDIRYNFASGNTLALPASAVLELLSNIFSA